MKIEHIAMYVNDLEGARDFFIKYFDTVSDERYHNKTTGFHSYLLTSCGGARLKEDGYAVLSGPRTTGDGYYESCVLGFEDNQIEIMI